jgi:HPt (histidine-containing phosphotransfer) domain-containing protein
VPEHSSNKGVVRFERDKLDELRTMSTPAAFVPLLSNLIEAIEQRAEAIRRFIAREELDAAAREAHDLVGIAGNVGGMRLSALSRQLQHACRAGDAPASRAVAAELEAEAKALVPLMRDYYAAMAA